MKLVIIAIWVGLNVRFFLIDDVKYGQTSIQNNMATITSTTPLLNQGQDVITANYNKTTDNIIKSIMDVDSICDTCRDGTLDDVNNLRRLNIDLNIRGVWGLTPLYYCVWSDIDPVEKVKVLVSTGAMLDVRDNYGHSLLHWACLYSKIDCIKYLLEQGLDKDARDNFYQTPLFYCVRSNNDQVEKVKLLVSTGAMLDVKEKDGRSLLDFARMLGSKECETYLREMGLDK